MATLATLKKLSVTHPKSLSIHADIKALLPEKDALALLKAGFTDCSWCNDSAPSYYSTQLSDDILIYVADDIDDDYNRLTDSITYYISAHNRDCMPTYSDISTAIDKAIELSK